jgi:hypothetical protein
MAAHGSARARPRIRRTTAAVLGAVLLCAAGTVTASPRLLGRAAAEQLGPRPVGASSRVPADTPVSSGSATVSGSGFGHGVGMSQYGALGMARAGFSAGDILSHYYTAVRVGAVQDAVDLSVNVAHGARSLTLAPLALSGTGQRLELTTPDGVRATVIPGDRAAVVATGARLAVSVTRAAGSTGSGPTSFGATRLSVRWTGTRALAGEPTLLCPDPRNAAPTAGAP